MSPVVWYLVLTTHVLPTMAVSDEMYSKVGTLQHCVAELTQPDPLGLIHIVQGPLGPPVGEYDPHPIQDGIEKSKKA